MACLPRVAAQAAVALLVCWLGLMPGIGHAQSNPVVVELYTSQGCSSCPPADGLLHKLAKREDVIALALHVDYWDYIGWKDAFALPAHAERQRSYARQGGRRSVYTPQMIINGMDSIVGARGMEISEAIMAHKSRDTGVTVSARHAAGEVTIQAEATAGAAPMDVILVRYAPLREIKITRGENAGRDMTYANVVEQWSLVASWSGQAPLHVNAALPMDAHAVVLVQSAGQGPIQAAAHIR